MRNIILIAGLLAAAPAFAQNPQPAPPQEPRPRLAPPNSPSPPPERIAPPENHLSERLSQQRGTITPPNVDPGMNVAPSPSQMGQGRTPVIPPPGAPGGNQSVVPK